MLDKKPNILLITLDEMRKDAIGYAGNKIIQTPNLDRLAEESFQFNKAYCTSPWCLPSRCSILTGLFPHNSGAYSNFRKCELDKGIPNLFNVLKQADYTTYMFGKCHFLPVPYEETRPEKTLHYDEFREYYKRLGIDHLYLQDDKQVSVWFYDDYAKELDSAGLLEAYRNAVWDQKNKKVFPFPGPAKWHPDSWVGGKAVEAIKSINKDGPIFSWVSFSGPHYPFDSPKEYYNRVNLDELKNEDLKISEREYNSPNRIHYKSYYGGGNIDGCNAAPNRGCKNFTKEYWLELRKNYYANIALIDDQIGRIINAAREKLGENLLIIFTADHGEMLGNHGIWGKHNCAYEDVWNVPLLIQYPKQKQGVETNVKVMLTDIFETCMKAADMKGIITDGNDLKDIIAAGGYEYVFAEGEGFIAVSDGKLKYVHIKKPGEEFYELLDLEADPNEYINVINQPMYQNGLAKLRGQAINHFIQKLLP